jgi:hypothetical protein
LSLANHKSASTAQAQNTAATDVKNDVDNKEVLTVE